MAYTRCRSMSAAVKLSLASVFALGLTPVVHAGVIYQTPTGATGVSGYISVNDRFLQGTQYHHPSFPSANAIDGDLSTRTDTYSGTELPPYSDGSDTAPLDFIGAIWGSTQSNIVSLRLHQFIYFDGGWFGTAIGDTNSTNASIPGQNTAAADAADAADVAAPVVQFTADGGTTWFDVVASEDYVSIVSGPVGNNFIGRIDTPITFAFATQSGVNGFRFVGYGGGRSDVSGGRDEQGFIAASEIQVGYSAVPEPTTLTLLGLGLAGLGWSRRQLKT